MLTVESVPLSQAQRGIVTYQIVAAAGEDLVATAQAVGTTTSLSLLDAQGHVLVQSDGLSPADPDRRDRQHTSRPGTYSLQVHEHRRQRALHADDHADAIRRRRSSRSRSGSDPDRDRGGGLHRRRPARPGRRQLRLDDTVSVLLGNGDGTFQPAGRPTRSGSIPIAIVAGDFTGDGKLDLAVANDGSTAPSRSCWATATARSSPRSPTRSGSSPDRDRGGGLHRRRPARPGRRRIAAPTTSRCCWATATARSSPPVDLRGRDRTPMRSWRGTSTATASSTWPSPTTARRRPAVSVLLGNGDGTFQPPVTYAVGYGPRRHRGGRLHRRRPARPGRRQLRLDDDVSVLLGNGDGTFQPPVTYAVGVEPRRHRGGRLHRRRPARPGRRQLRRQRRLGAAGQRRRHVPAPGRPTRSGSDPIAIVAGDFNGDGRLDLAVANAGLPTTVSVLLGNGDGTFQTAGRTNAVGSVPDRHRGGGLQRRRPARPGRRQRRLQRRLHPAGQRRRHVPARRSPTRSGRIPDAIVAGDFNGDGRLDLAVANDGIRRPSRSCWATATARSSPQVDLRGRGRTRRPSWRATSTATAGSTWPSPTSRLRRDVVGALLGNGDGTFQPAGHLRGRESYPTAIVAGDFTGDGQLDLAVAELRLANDVSRCCWATATARSSPRSTYAVGSDPDAIVAGDFNGDGQLDLAVAQRQRLRRRLGPAGQRRRHVPAPGHLRGRGRTQVAIVAGDFTGDGQLDLAVANYDCTTTSRCCWATATARSSPQVTYAVGIWHQVAIVAGDFNGDGQLDLAVANVDSNDVSVLLGNGDGTFVDPGQLATTPHATPLVADVNGDGTDDVLVVDGAGDILYRQGIPGQPGTFEPPVTVNPAARRLESLSRDIAWLPNTDHGPCSPASTPRTTRSRSTPTATAASSG